MHLFEKELCVSLEDIEFSFKGIPQLSWSNFLLNPRRLRGSDFLMRWSQGAWSEYRLTQATEETTHYFAIPYGPSGTAPTNDVRAYELYFERLEAAGLGKIKRPDLLIFKKSERDKINELIKNIGGLAELPFIKEDDLKELVAKAVIAVECENSLWKASKMPDFGSIFTPQKRLDGKLGLKKTAVLPTVIIKEEDEHPLISWQSRNKTKIHVWHVFYDRAYGLSLDEAMRLVKEGYVLPTEQVFQAPGGATTKKIIYKFPYQYAYPLAISTKEPKLQADCIEDKNGHILPYVKFEGGEIKILPEAITVLDGIRK